MKMYRPLNAFMLVKELEEPVEDNPSKLVLPGNTSKEFHYGKIVSMGEGAVTPNGSRIPPAVKVGDLVYFKEAGALYHRDLDVWRMTENQIVGVVEEDFAPPMA